MSCRNGWNEDDRFRRRDEDDRCRRRDEDDRCKNNRCKKKDEDEHCRKKDEDEHCRKKDEDDEDCLKKVICKNVGREATIFTANDSFTGKVKGVFGDLVRIVNEIRPSTPEPGPCDNQCNQKKPGLERVCDIPLDKIQAFCRKEKTY